MATLNVIDQATPQLQALIKRVENPLAGLRIAGRYVQILLKQHFQEKHKTNPNKFGAPRTNYWLGVSDAVNKPVDSGPDSVTVSISHPSFIQKVDPRPIEAKRHRYITIPLRSEAYARRAAQLEIALGIKLFVITAKTGNKFLVDRGGSDRTLRFFYLLRKSVNQKPDPTALPPEQKLNDVAMKAFGDWVLASQRQ